MKIKQLTIDDIYNDIVINEEILFVMPATDLYLSMRCAKLMSSRSGSDGTILIVMDKTKLGFVKICNLIFQKSQSQYFGYVAQDAFPGRAWLKLALDTLNRKQAGLLAFNDGKWHGLLAAFGLANTQWAIENYKGNIFYSGYQRHYADAELTLIAKSQNKLCYDSHSVLIEVDWEKDNRRTDINDKILFAQRAKSFFNGRVSDRKFCRIINGTYENS